VDHGPSCGSEIFLSAAIYRDQAMKGVEMNRISRGILFLTVLALPLWVGSCGDDNKNPSTPVEADLTVLSITWTPSNPEADQAITVSITVKNDGDADAAVSSTRLKVNGTASCEAIVTPAIAKGQQATVTCEIGGRAAGTHTLEANADIAGLIDESDEANNTRTASMTVTAPPAPDLIVESITFTPSPPVTSEPIIAHIVVHNQGTATAVATITSSDADAVSRCAEILTTTLPPGESVTVDCDLGELAAGAHAAAACADAGSAVAESDETNNCLSVGFTVNPPNTPDLIVESVTFTPAQPAAGEAVTAHAIVRNQGTGAATATVTSTEVDGAPACPTIATDAIPVDQTVTIDCALGSLTAGTHPIRVCADAGSLLNESSEENNCIVVNLEVSATAQPDLIVQEITFTPDPPVGNQEITAHIVVKNQGGAAAAASTTRTELDSQSVCEFATPGLAAGGTTTVDCALGVIGTGSHTVRACADVAAAVAESDETNNCTERSFEIAAAQADLVIDGVVFLPSSPNQGQPVSAQVTVRNAGGTLAAGSKTQVQLDGTTVCAEIATSSLPAGSSVQVTCNLGTPSVGSHTVEACADIATEVTEADETNNCASESFDVTAATNFPAFPIPDVSTCVDFQSADENALAAQQMVQLNLSLVSALASLGNVFLLPLEGAEWTDQGGGCWTWNYDDQQGCTGVYRVCQTVSGWEWTLTLNGTCGEPGDPPYVDWVAFRSTMENAEGTVGTFRIYAVNTTTVEGSWTWNVAADGRAGTWSFYDGDVSSGGTLNYTIAWAKNPDNSQDTTWIIPDSSKSETHVSEDCRSGYYKQYMWLGEPPAWVLQNEITWADGQGSNITYDESGQVIDEVTW
jgi:subtilase family serine protease